MVVRIRFRRRSRNRAGRTNRQAVLALATLIAPLSLMAWALGLWRLGADMKWTGEFAITQGLFSHWQVWFALAIALQFAAFLLHRYGGRDDNDDPAFS